MNKIKSLLVVWKNKDNLLYYHIGTLNYDGKYYTFTYTHHKKAHRKVYDAMSNGYFLHPSFPIIDQTYKSESLFPAFDRRIPSNDREDYAQILLDLGLDMNADRMDMLQATRGMLSGDTYSFEQPLRLNEEKMLQSEFYINGMRHRNLPSDWASTIQIREQLYLIPEPTNDKDKKAVRIETSKGLHLGYIPGFYAEAIGSLIKNNINPILTIKDIRPNSSPQWWVYLSFSCDLSSQDSSFFNTIDPNGIIQVA